MLSRYFTGIALTGLLLSCGNDATTTDTPSLDDGGNASPPDGGGCAEGTWDHDGDPSTPCIAWSSCAAGTYMVDRTCVACATGSYSVTTNATACVAWSACGAGTYVSAPGSATADRMCTACGEGTFSATANAANCTAWTDCAPGTYVSTPGSTTANRACIACGEGTFSNTTNAASCSAWTDCAAGTSVSASGSATADRACTACGEGTFSVTTNTASCSAWTACGVGYEERTPGSSTRDRTCAATPWTRQFGSSAMDGASSASVDGSGLVYVAGYTYGALPGQTSAGDFDAFVRVYDATGTELWTRQFGSSGNDQARSVSVDGSGNVYVAGSTNGTLGQTSAGATDAFVRKYNASGAVLWTRQFGSSTDDFPRSMSVDGSGNVYVAGFTAGTLPGQSSAGGRDAFVRKYDASGAELWTRQFGTSSTDGAESVSVDGSGNVYVAGDTYGTLSGQTRAGETDAFVRKYNASGTELWTRQFGSSASDRANSVSVDGSGNVYVAGYTYGALPGQTSTGDADAFVRKYDASGAVLWTRQFGSSTYDVADSVSADGSGNVYVAGNTRGAFPGQTSAGETDVFVRMYDASGAELWTRQFGSSSWDSARAVSPDGSGNVYVAGATGAALPGQTSQGDGDAYVARLVP